MANPDAKLYVGIDWATELHQVLAMDPDGKVLGEQQVKHSASGLSELVKWLDSFGCSPEETFVAIEVPHGAIVETLLERKFQVFSINPKQLDRFRDRFSVAGAKDDRLDSRVLADSLRTDEHCFRRVQIDPAHIIELRELSRMYDDLRRERIRATNRLRGLLWRYFPQYLEITEDVGADWVLDLWDEIPSPDRASRRRRATVERILKAHRIRRVTAEQVLDALCSKPLEVADGTERAAVRHIKLLGARVHLLNQQLKETRKQMDGMLHALASPDADEGQPSEQRDVAIVLSLPGVGTINGATLLSEAAQPLERRDYHALRSLTGVAPVTRQSGKRRIVAMRQGCSMRLRQATYHIARVAVQRDDRSKQRYAALRARGKPHGQALRVVADRLLCVLTAMLRNQTVYQPSDATPSKHAQSEPTVAVG